MAADSTLKDILLNDLSRKHAESIAAMTLKKPAIFDELWEIALSDEYPVNWRAAWVMDGIWERSPEIVRPFVPKMWALLPQLKVDGVKREFLKIISESPLPEDEERLGILLGICFDWLNVAGEAIAVRVYSMQILFNISRKIPEIIPELKTTIEVAMQEGSPAVLSRGRKILQKLMKKS